MKHAPLPTTMRPRLASKARLKWDRHEQRYFLLYPERGMSLNGTAARIVQLCCGDLLIEQIIAQLASEFGAAPQIIRADVMQLLTILRDKALLTDASSGVR